MKELFIASDHHFQHKNILKYQAHTRPWTDLEEHNEGLIQRHNSLVKPSDDVYFLGDFAFTRNAEEVVTWLQSMNGNKHYIFGNHDKIMHDPQIKSEFVWMKNYFELKTSKRGAPIVMFHYPIFSWNRMHHGALHFYGHTHGSIPKLFSGRARDIGVDTSDCYPLNIDEIAQEMKKLEVQDARDR